MHSKVDPSITLKSPMPLGTGLANIRPATILDDDLNTVKLGNVAIQGSESKVTLITVADMRAGKENYKTREGAYPTKMEMPTREQASAFLALLRERESVFLDFAVFGPTATGL